MSFFSNFIATTSSLSIFIALYTNPKIYNKKLNKIIFLKKKINTKASLSNLQIIFDKTLNCQMLKYNKIILEILNVLYF